MNDRPPLKNLASEDGQVPQTTAPTVLTPEEVLKQGDLGDVLKDKEVEVHDS